MTIQLTLTEDQRDAIDAKIVEADGLGTITLDVGLASQVLRDLHAAAQLHALLNPPQHQTPPSMADSVWLHVKSGAAYAVIGEAALHCARDMPAEGAGLTVCKDVVGDTWACCEEDSQYMLDPSDWLLATRVALQSSAGPVEHGTLLTVYRGLDDGKTWARPTPEFLDGRFQRVQPGVPGPGNGPSAAANRFQNVPNVSGGSSAAGQAAKGSCAEVGAVSVSFDLARQA